MNNNLDIHNSIPTSCMLTGPFNKSIEIGLKSLKILYPYIMLFTIPFGKIQFEMKNLKKKLPLSKPTYHLYRVVFPLAPEKDIIWIGLKELIIKIKEINDVLHKRWGMWFLSYGRILSEVSGLSLGNSVEEYAP